MTGNLRRGFGWLLVALSAWCAVGCVAIDPEEPVDKNGDPIKLPGPADRWLQIVASTPEPGEVALQPSFAFRFNDYIDPDSFESYGFASLKSGGIQATGHAFYRMTDKTVVWRPSRKLEAGLIYTLQLRPEVRSATGAPFLPPHTGDPRRPGGRIFLPTRDAPPPADSPDDFPSAATSAALPDTRWAQVQPIFVAHCASCHSDPKWKLNPLSYESLLGASTRQTDLYLIRPGNPADSYLMRKVLWDYPDIRYTAQPPPWSPGAQELSREDLLTIEGWIAHGARR